MKRPVISERMFLYWTDREHPNTCRMTVRMQDAIELTMMQEALRQTQTRYPYYSVRLGVTSDANGREHYEYDDNPASWVLNIGQEPVELFGAASHYHQLAFACWDDCVAIDFFHGLTDGTGAYNVLRTLMYEYCRRRYDAQLSNEGIRKAGETVDESEWTDLHRCLNPNCMHCPCHRFQRLSISSPIPSALCGKDTRSSTFA